MSEPRTDLKAKPLEDEAAKLAEAALIEAQIEAKVQARFERLEAKLLAVAAEQEATGMVPGPIQPDSGIKALLENLSMAFAEVSAQGVGVQKPIAPDLLRARAASMEEMIALLKKARDEGLTPTYRLRSPVYFDEAYVIQHWTDSDHVQQPTDIDWPGAPNLAMVPLNEIATQIMAAFKGTLANTLGGGPSRAEELSAFRGGLNVKGPKKVAKQAGPAGQFDADPSSYQGLKIKHKGARGQGKLTHVLGTISPPALISE